MTPDRYREILELLDITQVGAGKFFGVDERTSRRWARGKLEIPDSVAMLLELMIARKIKPAYVLGLIGKTDAGLHDQRRK